MIEHLNKVIAVSTDQPYWLIVTFEDGSKGAFDMAQRIGKGPMSKPLQDYKFFSQVKLDYGAPTWPNGFDICPDALKMQMAEAGTLKQPTAAE